jgi:WD40 repeat protein
VCGGYQLEREIGRGGTGVVFLARLPGIGRPFALKMPAARFAGPDELRRFRIEVESVAGLDHPNIIPVHATGEEDGRPYFVMKHASGGSLHDVLRARNGRPAAEIRRDDVVCIAKVARAVQFAHERGILHRDLKPANILLGDSREPLVSDFGLARLLDAPAGATLTGSAIGTPAYMAPEQAAGATVTTAADIYSLGAVLFHLLAGRPPFQEDSPLETLRRVATEDPPDPRTFAPDLDRDLATICLKCLHRDPPRRYHSAADLADDLDRWLAGEPVLARRTGHAERLMKWARRHPAIAALAISTVVAACAFAAILSGGSSLLRQERNEALKQERLARENSVRASQAAEAFRQNAYAADIYLASRAIEDGQLGVARRMLERHLPQQGDRDLRGFEWHAFRHQCRGSETRVFRGHHAAVTAVAFDPTGRQVASAGRDGLLLVHERDTGMKILSLPHPDAPRRAGEIPMMTLLAARSPEVTSLILTGRLTPDEMRMRARPSQLGEFSSIAWSPDGNLLATGSTGAYVRLWKMPEGELIGFLPMPWVTQLAFSDDSGLLVSLMREGDRSDLRIHRVGDLTPVRTISNIQPSFGLARGKLAVLHSDSLRMEISDLQSGALLHSWDAGCGISALALSPDATRIHAIDPLGRKTTVWQTADGRRISEQAARSGTLRALTLTADGHTRITAGTGQSLFFENPDDGLPVSRGSGHEDEILALAAASDSRWTASASNDHTVRLWDTRLPTVKTEPNPHDGLRPVEAAPDARSWLSQSGTGGLFHCRPGEAPRALQAPADCQPLGFDGTGTRILTWRPRDQSAVIEWWDTSTLAPAGSVVIPVDLPRPWLVNTSTDGRLCAITRPRSPVFIHDLTNGSPVHRFPKPDMLVSRMAFSADGARLMIQAWPRDTRIGALGGGWSSVWKLSAGTVGPVIFSPDGKWLASGGDDNTISIRDVATGRIVRELAGHRSQIVALAFTPDGGTLASASGDRTLRLWHTATWRSLGTLDDKGLDSFIRFDRHGRHLLVVPYQTAPFLIPGADGH